MRLLVILKSIQKRFMLIDNYCHNCGRSAEVFNVPDDVWQKVVGDPHKVLCIQCFKDMQRSMRYPPPPPPDPEITPITIKGLFPD